MNEQSKGKAISKRLPLEGKLSLKVTDEVISWIEDK